MRFILAVSFCAVLAAQTPPDLATLESRIQSNPDDPVPRALLLRTVAASPAIPLDRAKALRREHILWLIEHKPADFYLSENSAGFEKSGSPLADPESWAVADALWRQQITAAKSPDVYVNAITFYRFTDAAYARTLTLNGAAAFPDSPRLGLVKGKLLAFTILGVRNTDRYGAATSFDDALAKSDEATHARAELATSDDPNMVGGAAETLNQQTTALFTRDRTAQLNDVAPFIETLFQRAAKLDPSNPRWKTALASFYWTASSRKPVLAEKIALLEKALTVAGVGFNRSFVQADLAEAYLQANDLAKASAAATELLTVTANDANYGGAIHHGNIVLGRIALRNNDVEQAKRRLLAAGGTPGSPVLNSFGPDWNLAQEVYAKGDHDSVLSYIELCRKFWKMDRGRLDTWAAAIQAGNSPNFLGPPPIQTPNLIGRPAPEFRLPTLKGGEISLSELKGKVVLLDFWATWCGPCRQEMPTFEKLHKEFTGKDVVILPIDVNEPNDLVNEYIAKEKFTFPVPLTMGTDVAGRYGINAYPTLVTIDKAGLVADYLIGSRNEATLRGAIEKARAGAPPPSNNPAPTSTFTAPPAPSAVRPQGVPPPATAEDFYREAVRMHLGKDLPGAVKALDSAIQINPRMAPAWELRGHANADLRRMPQAIADYTRAIELFPYVPSAYNNRGQAYSDTNKLDEALADFTKAISLNPAYLISLQNRSRLYLSRKQYAEVIADCDAALRASPSATWAASRKIEARNLMNGGTPAPELAAPKLLSPAAGATFGHFPRETTLVWAEIPGAASYVVEWDYKGDSTWATEQRGNPGAMLRATQPTVTFNFIGAQEGRWRVWALDSQGREGARSDWRSFTYTR